MKRFYIGIGLLLILLILGLWTSIGLDGIHGSIAEDFRQASLESDWHKAEALAQSAREAWEECWYLSAALADHTAIDEIDALLAELTVYRRQQDEPAHAAICARLSELVEALEENHRFSWWNLL